MYRPEVGEECLASWYAGQSNIKCVITYMGDEVGCYKTDYHTGEMKEFSFAFDAVMFRPLKSEREETIERIAEALRQTFVGSCYAEANRLYDAGLRFKEDNQDV